MRKVALWALVVCTLLACGSFNFGSSSDLELDIPILNEGDLVPTAAVPDRNEGEQDAAADTPRIPPTWTPQSAPAGSDNPPPAVATTPVPGLPPGTETYTVQPGDTLANIAYKYGISVFDLAEANDIENIDLIEVGQVLVIP